ncbi:MAG: glycosyltransferase [Rickettsiales bacterium]|nr:glycosyltransferase [Rickettsiales bacterium]
MKILFVGNFGYKKNFQHFYNCDYKFYFGLIKNGHSVYQFSNRDLARQEGFFKSRFGSQKTINKKLLKTINELKPEIIFLSHCGMIENETLQIIREQNKNIRIAEINVDALWVDKIKDYLTSRCLFIDALFLTSSGSQLDEFRKINPKLKVSYVGNPVDESIEKYRCFENENFSHDVFFAGSNGYREETINFLKNKLPNIKFNILGQGSVPLKYGQNYINELITCHTGLNLPQFTEEKFQPPLYSSDRIAQYMGNGLLTIIHAGTGLQEIFEPEVDAIFYSNWEDLAEKIQEYKLNKIKRKTIAKNGCEKYHMLYSSKKITLDMVDLVVS